MRSYILTQHRRKGHVMIADLSGRLVRRKQIREAMAPIGIKIDLSGLSEGVYIVLAKS